MKDYYQCKIRKVGTTMETVGWIEERDAMVGAQVEVLPEKNLWEVVSVGDRATPEADLKAYQLANRHSRASIDPIV